MTTRVKVGFEVAKCILLLIIALLQLLILLRQPPTLGDRHAVAAMPKAERKAKYQQIRRDTPLVHVEGQVEAYVSSITPLEVKVTDPVALEDGTLVLVEAASPIPVEIER